LPPSTHSIKSTHGTWHGRVLLNDDNFVCIKKEITLVDVWHRLLSRNHGLLTIIWWRHVVIEAWGYVSKIPWFWGG
jgi:hypothetical protein